LNKKIYGYVVKMNICIISRNFPPDLGGIENIIFGHARFLADSRHKVIVLTKFSKKTREKNIKTY